MKKIVVVGAGIACVSAIKAIRQNNEQVEIVVYGEEPYFPYKRIRLTKELAGKLQEQNLIVEKKSWYEENQVTLNRDKKVVRIDPAAHKIFLSDGTSDKYSTLLLANGARNHVLPIKGINKKNVFTLRSLRDAKMILKHAEQAKQALVIGGGVLGMETAWSLIKLGKQVTVIEALPRLMPKQLDEDASNILRSIAKDSGVVIYEGTQVQEITGDKEVSGFITSEGLRYPCDMVIHCTGIRPNIELVKDTGIKTNHGIIVNERMETNIPDIYAAGDVAEFKGAVLGLWNVASLQGEIAGMNMIGISQIYETPAAATVMNAFHCPMFSIGDAVTSKADIVLMDPPKDNKYRKILLYEGEILGAISVGSIKEFPYIKRAMDQKITFPEVYEENVQLSDFLNLVKEKQIKEKLQPEGAATRKRQSKIINSRN